VTANPVFQHGEPPVLFKPTPNASVHASTPDLNLFLVGMLIAALGPVATQGCHVAAVENTSPSS
jgi:hypothetical protein